MKNYTFSFIDLEELQEKINIDFNDEKMLMQLFCANTNLETIQSIQTYIREKFPKSTFIGTTTDGIIDGIKVYANTKHVLTCTRFYETSLKSTLVKNETKSLSNYEMGKRVAQNLCEDGVKVIISFADGIETNGEEYVNGIHKSAKDVIIAGGLAADNGQLKKTYVFDKYDITSLGAVGVALNNKALHVRTSYTFDWIPIGKKMLVSKAVKNRVYEIDGLSTVEIYAKYMGQELANQLPQVGIEFPLIFERDGVSVGRAALDKHKDGSLTFAGNIAEGEFVRFGVGNIDRLLKNSNLNTKKLIDSMECAPEAVFVYSCMARRRFMNTYIEDELKGLKHLGNVSGFFTYGEFYHARGANQLLNETMTLLALSEECHNISCSTEEITPRKYDKDINAQQVIANLANRVSKELEELNENLESRVQESAAYIYEQAYYDKLTGLPNRLSLLEKLEDNLGKTLILVNIDDFTSINDFYGHQYGDIVLKKLAEILQKMTEKQNAEVFKLQSDEYAIIVDTSQDTFSMEKRIKNCIAFIENEEFIINGYMSHVSVTTSVAFINPQKTAFVNADMALKLAKKAKKDYMIFNDDLELTQLYERNIKMANIIKNAIHHDEIILYFQPICDVRTGKIDKYETLVRLKKDDETVFEPYNFLDVSQKIKLYPQITRIVIEKAFIYFSQNGLDFSINLAFEDIFNKKTKQFLFDKIQEYHIASQLTIEILETQENDNEKLVNSFIEEVYSVGAKIAIDDFGSGFANFQHITNMRSDIMKIDGSLIKNINRDKNARLIVETILVFAQKLDKKVIAEFVHSEEVYEIVKELGIDYAQGYYLGKPLAHVL